MKAAVISVTISMACSFLSGVVPALADTVVITYRSGKVQTITLDERMEEVTDIGYRKSSHSLPSTREKVGEEPQPDTKKDLRKEPASSAVKPGITIKWAPPIQE